jgi:RND family efflux transporter MFP subunit
VTWGDVVKPGQVIAVVGDDKLLLQIRSLDAQIAGLQSQVTQAEIDVGRAETLFRQGAGSKATLDQARTGLRLASSALSARTAEREVAQQTLQEGQVLAPVAGRVLTVPVTPGTVVLNGDTIATIGEQPYILRLRLPERHAAFTKAGDTVRIDAGQVGAGATATGRITLVYPRIEEGRVVADAVVPDLRGSFVGDRVRVWIAAGTRAASVVPAGFIATRFGLDYVRLRLPDDSVAETPVQRGADRPGDAVPDGVEILSGVAPGDVLVKP